MSYYHLHDLHDIATQMHGERFGQWILTKLEPNEALFRIAQETSRVLLPGRGFGGKQASGRASLANLNEYDHANIGRSLRGLASEYFAIFEKENGGDKGGKGAKAKTTVVKPAKREKK